MKDLPGKKMKTFYKNSSSLKHCNDPYVNEYFLLKSSYYCNPLRNLDQSQVLF